MDGAITSEGGVWRRWGIDGRRIPEGSVTGTAVLSGRFGRTSPVRPPKIASSSKDSTGGQPVLTPLELDWRDFSRIPNSIGCRNGFVNCDDGNEYKSTDQCPQRTTTGFGRILE